MVTRSAREAAIVYFRFRIACLAQNAIRTRSSLPCARTSSASSEFLFSATIRSLHKLIAFRSVGGATIGASRRILFTAWGNFRQSDSCKRSAIRRIRSSSGCGGWPGEDAARSGDRRHGDLLAHVNIGTRQMGGHATSCLGGHFCSLLVSSSVPQGSSLRCLTGFGALKNTLAGCRSAAGCAGGLATTFAHRECKT